MREIDIDEELHLPKLWLFQDALTKIGCRAPLFQHFHPDTLSQNVSRQQPYMFRETIHRMIFAEISNQEIYIYI